MSRSKNRLLSNVTYTVKQLRMIPNCTISFKMPRSTHSQLYCCITCHHNILRHHMIKMNKNKDENVSLMPIDSVTMRATCNGFNTACEVPLTSKHELTLFVSSLLSIPE